MIHHILLIKPTNSSFIAVEEAALKQNYRLKTHYLKQDKGRLAYLSGLLGIFPKFLLNPQTKVVLVWFADYHALPSVLLARLTRKKSVIFIGGYDAVCYPEFTYGVYCNPVRSFCARTALKLSDLIIANDDALLHSDNRYYNSQGHPEGVYRLVEGLATPAMVIPNAPVIKTPSSLMASRKRQILSVGGTPRYEDVYNKGFDLLFELARSQPDWHVVIIGISTCWLNRLESEFKLSELKNLQLMPPQPHAKVLECMVQSQLYVQASISEGMPNALMEAMLCGCIPVGSNVAGIPKLIGEWGVVFHERKTEKLMEAIDQARQLQLNPQTISASIPARYSIEKRSEALNLALSSILQPAH